MSKIQNKKKTKYINLHSKDDKKKISNLTTTKKKKNNPKNLTYKTSQKTLS